MIPVIWYIAPAGAIIALIFSYILFNNVKKKDPGTEQMQTIAKHVRDGAFAYLRQQYKGVTIFFILAFIIFNIMAHVLHVLHWLIPFAFLTGGFFSGLAGWIGMNTATLASNRTTQAASNSLNQGLRVAFKAGGVMGLVVVGLGLIDISIWFYVTNNFLKLDLHTITVVMLSFGMGASTQALFARLGGGIFTKAADVGADLVGKVEAGIPEDDPRNPATIADNVGDNVGDVAGMGADLYESYCGSILATAALGMAAVTQIFGHSSHWAINFVIAPMVMAGIGSFLSIIGIFMASTKEDADTKDLMFALNKGVYGSSILIAIAAFFITKFMLPAEYSLGVFLSTIIGLAAGILIGFFTELSTSHSYNQTRGIAQQGEYGPATIILEGLAVGMKSTAAPVVIIGIAIIGAFSVSKGFYFPEMGLYGIGFGAVGMLSTLGVTLAMDAFGPIADNAGGNAEMCHLPEEVRKRTDALDSVGNTTAATGKGFAIGSAALTAMALLAAYLEEVRNGLHFLGMKVLHIQYSSGLSESVELSKATIANFVNYYQINLMNPKLLVGIFLGAMTTFVFAALTIKAVGRAAGAMVGEVRRQFKEIPGILEGTAEPEYAKCVMISTKGAQKEMIAPALLGILTPIAVGLILGVAGVMGVLAGGLTTGFVLAVMMNNAGGAWDNAKKYIEIGHYGGKGSDYHKAGIVGDTVGDPFKDTAGPSINILIKLMSMVSIVFAGLIVAYSPIVESIYSGKKEVIIEKSEIVEDKGNVVSQEELDFQKEMQQMRDQQLQTESELENLRKQLDEKEVALSERENELLIELSNLHTKRELEKKLAEIQAKDEIVYEEKNVPVKQDYQFSEEFQQVNDMRMEAETELSKLVKELEDMDLIQAGDVEGLFSKFQLINDILMKAQLYLEDVRRNFVEKNVIRTLKQNQLQDDFDNVSRIKKKAEKEIKRINSELASLDQNTESTNKLKYELQQNYQVKLQAEKDIIIIRKNMNDNNYILSQWEKQLTYEQKQIDNIKKRADYQLDKVKHKVSGFGDE